MKHKPSFRIWFFILAVYLLSAILWIPIIISGKGMASPLNTVLMALITFVPSSMGILFTYLVKTPEERHDFLKRAFRWPKTKLSYIMAGLLIFPVLNITSYILSFVLSGQVVKFDNVIQVFSSLPLFLQFLFVEITFGALSEELGWRGYLLDEMQSKWSALKSALVLGIFWGLWHTPAFLITGLAQHEMGGVLSPQYASFTCTAILASILMTWIYNNTGHSILVAGFLMHFLTNASLVIMTGMFGDFSVPNIFWTISIVIYSITSIVVIIVWGPKSLTRNPKQPEEWAFTQSSSSD
jgi:membrane protease YdiL (CAAX protease family)